MSSESKNFPSKLKGRLQKGKRLGTLFLAALLPALFLAALPVRATTYYVATNGNDLWSGTSSNYVSGTNGPWLDFMHVSYGGTPQLKAGDVLYVRGGVYDHSSDSLPTCLFLSGVFGTSANPVIISNYPGETVIISNSGVNYSTIRLDTVAWVKVFGINSTNAYRCPLLQWATNCEVAYCDFGGGNTNLGPVPNEFQIYNNSQSNWIHNNVVHDSIPSPVEDSGKLLTLGNFYSATDFTSYNLVESNTCFHSGHDALSCYGPSNVLRNNWVHNEPFFIREDYQLFCGERDVELGGTFGNYNVFENNWCAYAGVTGTGGSHGIECSDAAYEIIRNNCFLNCAYSGFTIYGGKVGGTICTSNYIYNNTIYNSGFGPLHITNYNIAFLPFTIPVPYYVTNINPLILPALVPTATNNYLVWQWSASIANTSNNVFANNLLWGNYLNQFEYFDGSNIDVGVYKNNMTNLNPLFLNTNDTGPFQNALPNLNLPWNSPAVDAGAFLTTITSSSGSGTTFTVADANYFCAGLTASGHALPGDTIQLQGQVNTSTITAIVGKTITVNNALTWTNGQALALAYAGSAPDVGAYEFYPPPLIAPTNLHIVSQ